ncbi:MAG: ethylbenzene dehydrogenase-related protein [Betaproteobacteria bacterium]|nr:ethylbenzene dehydrogenase-related protein [Betaproteobacteria bacterium]
MKKSVLASILGSVLCFAASNALAEAPSDWSKIKALDTTLFYPGVSPMEWINKGTEHGGARGMKKGETCMDCHSEEIADMGGKMVSGQKIEPNPIPGKAAAINVKVQAARDDEHLYLRFTWKQPKASGAAKMDTVNPVKIAYMIEAGSKVEMANISGCWSSCHGDARTMPGADDNKTKYVKNGSLANGIFYDLNQWRSGENKAFDGYVAEKRVMEGGQALQSATGKLNGDTWTVEFKRKLAGSDKGDVELKAGQVYNFGFAIHDDNTIGRYHHVSLNFKLGIDSKADIVATKQ